MKRFYDGYWQSREQVMNLSEEEYLQLIDALYGRENLPDNYTLEQLKQEALEQHKQEWTTPDGKKQEENVKAISDAIIANHRRLNRIETNFLDN